MVRYNPEMGITVFVYRAARGSDTTNGGISANHDTLTVVNVDGPFDPTDREPPALLVQGPGVFPDPILVPAEYVDGAWVEKEYAGHIGPMSGGNYAGTSDSRWCQAVRELGGIDLARIHDRFETPEIHELLSR